MGVYGSYTKGKRKVYYLLQYFLLENPEKYK